ncbi:WD40/YVTN/BNR-like repeat-containing protein [Leptospira ryugenii]|nr:YCF48-related protein [Leptospira ryugenii]
MSWQEVHRKPTGNFKNGGLFLTDQIGFIIGQSGLVMRTADGGANWRRLVAGDRDHNINTIESHPFTRNLFIGGGNETYTSSYFQFSEDSGRTWKQIPLDTTVGAITALQFLKNSGQGFLAFAVADPARSFFYASDEQGKNWQRYSEVNFLVSGFKGFENGQFYAWGTNNTQTQSYFVYSNDFGKTWTSRPFNTGMDASRLIVSFVSTEIGFISGIVSSSPVVRKTTDGGQTYATVNLPSDIDSASQPIIDFLDDQTGFMISSGIAPNYYPFIDKTTDGGNSWRRTYSPNIPSVNVSNAGFIKKNRNDLVCYIDSSFGPNLIQSSDGGESWSARGEGENSQFGRVTMVSDTVGYTSGGFTNAPRIVLKTTDGGNSWQTVFRSVTGLFRSIYANPNGLVWSVGNQRMAVYSTNGGLDWNVPASFGSIAASSEFRGVAANQSGVVLLAVRVGSTGNISRSTDSGVTWNIAFPINANMTDVKFIDETTAIAVSGLTSATNFSAHGVYLSTDSGANWTQVPSMAGVNLYDIHVLNANTIFVGSGASNSTSPVDSAYISTDRGQSWRKIFEKNAKSTFNTSVLFLDERNGIVSGTSGTWRTSDQGQNWIRELPMSDNSFIGLTSNPSKNKIIGVGGSGTIQMRNWP